VKVILTLSAPPILLRTTHVALAAWLAIALPALPLVVRGEAPVEQTIATWPAFLQRAHSHNDYQQKRPFRDAVEAGLTSVEADLWLENGKLVVGHDRGKWRGDFEALYLQPLARFWQEAKLPVAADQTFLLWLDIKDDNAVLRSTLHRLLETQPWMRPLRSDEVRIQVILTGSKESKEAYVEEYVSPTVTRDSNTFLEEDPPGAPNWSWYALDWKKISHWNGIDDLPEEDRARLRALVSKVHEKGRKLRLWSHPRSLRFWQEAVDAGVDRIGTDVLPGD
jgi:hypothetical protein